MYQVKGSYSMFGTTHRFDLEITDSEEKARASVEYLRNRAEENKTFDLTGIRTEYWYEIVKAGA